MCLNVDNVTYHARRQRRTIALLQWQKGSEHSLLGRCIHCFLQLLEGIYQDKLHKINIDIDFTSESY